MMRPRDISIALLCCVAGAPLRAQLPAADTLPPSAAPDRYVLDVAQLVRESGARTLSELLAGQVPGFLVIAGSGLQGSGARVRFAGARSLLDHAPPLVLLDGLPIDAIPDATMFALGGPGPSRLDDVPLEEIERVEIIPGPAAGAHYGPGAAAGVILIHSKRGRSGALRWQTFGRTDVRTRPGGWPANFGGVDVDNPDPRMRTGACTLTAQAAGDCVQDFVQRFNPLRERDPFVAVLRRQVGFSGSGGPSWGAFRAGLGYEDADPAYAVPAIWWDDDRQNWHGRIMADVSPLRWLSAGVTVLHVSSNLRLPLYDPIAYALLGPSDSSGFAWDPSFRKSLRQDLDRTQAIVHVRARPISWVQVEGTIGREDVDQDERGRVPGSSRAIAGREVAERVTRLTVSSDALRWRGLRFTTTAGIERRTQRRYQTILASPDTTCVEGVPCLGGSFSSRLRSLSFHVAERIDLGDRLTVSGAIRRDEFDDLSFADATSPSIAVDWVARSARAQGIGRVAVRAAFGSAAQSLTSLVDMLAAAPFGSVGGDLRPERTRGFEVGATADLLDGRWQLRTTFYDMRSDVFDWVILPASTGPSGTGYRRGAVLSNRGVAVTLGGPVVDRPDLAWDLRLIIWGNRNRVDRHAGVPGALFFAGGALGQADEAGFPAGGYWARPVASADLDANGIITLEELSFGDYAWAGTPEPTQGAAMTSVLRLAARWRVSTLVEYRAGHTLLNRGAWTRCLAGVCRPRVDPSTSLADQADAVPTGTPAPRHFEDADYLKVREVAVNFDVPIRIAAVVGARSAQLTLSGRDLLTWASYSGPDPETGSYGMAVTGQRYMVHDYFTVPVPASWAVRLSLAY